MNTNPPTAPDLSMMIGGIPLKCPIMTASGTFGYGREYAPYIDLNQLGAVVVKGISLQPAAGNPPPRMVETRGGLLNAIGLQNPGADVFVRDYLPFFRDYQVAVIVNIWGRSLEDYEAVAERLSGVPGIHGLELNISCPNIKEGGMAFGTNPVMTRQVISRVRAKTRLPLIPKLSPNVAAIAEFAKLAEDCGADALSLINSFPAMAVDIETQRPALANVVGGLTGPAIHPIAVRLVWEAAKAVKIPIIAMGGITDAREAIEFFIVGASAVAVGTANFTDPGTALAIASGLEAYLKRKGLSSIRELIGSLQI